MMNLKTMINEIQKKEVLIPDFQRGFVWKDIEMQKRLVASVLAKLPVGSVLLLDGDPNEFQSKQIGRKNKIDVVQEGTKKYLLDGQQRMTVLTNVFSNVILEEGQLSKLISTSLKNRFFLHFTPCYEFVSDDLFGLSNFIFPFEPSEEPDFLAQQAYEKISVESSVNHKVFDWNFTSNDLHSVDQIIKYCTEDKNNPKLPLFLLSTSEGLTLTTEIIREIAKYREEYLSDIVTAYFIGEDDGSFEKFIETIRSSKNPLLADKLVNDENNVMHLLKNMKEEWIHNMRDYLYRVIEKMKLSEIIVPNSQRARAIDIYENLNKGGVTLSTFDLIVAKAAQIEYTNFVEKIVSELSENLELNDILPYGEFINRESLYEKMGLFDDRKNEFSSAFINVFLNLLSIRVRTSDDDFNVNLSDAKREAVLSLSSEEILDNYKQVVKGIKRAMCFMHAKLGIRKISDVKYEHVLLNLSRAFMFDAWWNNHNVHKKLEYWYWIVVFSGSYDKDQSYQMIQDMRVIDKFLKGEIDFNDQYFVNLKERIFSDHYFTNKDILMMEQVEYNNIPKKVVRDLIVQYALSNMPIDFVRTPENQPYHLKTYDGIDKEIHHIIPLATCTIVGESTKKLRGNDEHYLNSPLNFTIISKLANNRISSEPLESYISRLPAIATNTHMIPNLSLLQNDNSEINHKIILSARYDEIKSKVVSELSNLAS